VTNQDLKYARNSVADGSGTWTITSVDTAGSVGRSASLAVVAGKPAISYGDGSNGDIKYASNSAVDGSGTWTFSVVHDSTIYSAPYTSLAEVNGKPAISYEDGFALKSDLRTQQRSRWIRHMDAHHRGRLGPIHLTELSSMASQLSATSRWTPTASISRAIVLPMGQAPGQRAAWTAAQGCSRH